MTEDEFLEARDLMANALARAKKVLVYFTGEENSAKIDLLENGDAMVTTWESVSGDYDSHSIEEAEQTFPGHLLFCTDEEVDAWLLEKKRAREAKYQADNEARVEQAIAAERAAYEALKAKYG